MAEIIGSISLGNSLLGSILNLFNLNVKNNKEYFEKAVEPGYFCLKDLHSNYINKLILYKNKVKQSNYTINEINDIVDIITSDMQLSEEMRIKLLAICKYISKKKKNKEYSELLRAFYDYIEVIINKNNLYIEYEVPKDILRCRDDFYNNIDVNQKILYTENQLKEIKYKEESGSNAIRILLIKDIKKDIDRINKSGLNSINGFKKRFAKQIDDIIHILNNKLTNVEMYYWNLKNKIY